MPGTTWTTELDFKFLLSILASNPNLKIDYEAVSKKLEEDGISFTVDALRSRMKRIKKQINESATDTATQTAGSPSKKNTPAKGTKRAAVREMSSQDDEEPSPRKQKLSVKPEKQEDLKVKVEEEPGSGHDENDDAEEVAV